MKHFWGNVQVQYCVYAQKLNLKFCQITLQAITHIIREREFYICDYIHYYLTSTSFSSRNKSGRNNHINYSFKAGLLYVYDFKIYLYL